MDLRPSTEVSYAGPRLDSPSSSSSRQGGSNISRRIRRTQGSTESDDFPPILGDSEIWNEDFHCGGPKLIRLPGMNQHLRRADPLEVAWEDQLKKPIMEIIERHNIDYMSAGVLRRAHQANDSGSTNWHDTVLISARKHALDDSWFRACKEMVQFLRAKGFMNLNVEILDLRATHRTLTFPISATDPFVVAWEALRPDILNVLGDKQWIILSVVRRGKEEAPKHITIAITVAEDSTDEWSTVRERILQLLDAQKHYSVAVEISRGRLWYATLSTPTEDPVLELRDWDVKARLGGSLGPHRSEASASTFGGFLEIEQPNGIWKKIGITNYHSVIAGKDALSWPLLPEWSRYGMKPSEKRNEINLDHPSLRDHIRSLQHHRSLIGVERSVIPEEVRQRVREGDPSVSRRHKKLHESTLASMKKSQDVIQHGLDFFASGKHYLGRVIAASGFRPRADNDRLLDWALIDVVKDRISQNELPQTKDVKTPYRSTYLPDHPTVQGIAELEDEMRLYKLGGKTGFTGGILNGVREADLHGWTEDAQGRLGFFRGKANLIMPFACTTFGDPGDSGSFVIDGEGRFAGLYFGGDQSRGTGLFIEAKDLFEDIKHVTGARDVRIPEE